MIPFYLIILSTTLSTSLCQQKADYIIVWYYNSSQACSSDDRSLLHKIEFYKLNNNMGCTEDDAFMVHGWYEFLNPTNFNFHFECSKCTTCNHEGMLIFGQCGENIQWDDKQKVTYLPDGEEFVFDGRIVEISNDYNENSCPTEQYIYSRVFYDRLCENEMTYNCDVYSHAQVSCCKKFPCGGVLNGASSSSAVINRWMIFFVAILSVFCSNKIGLMIFVLSMGFVVSAPLPMYPLSECNVMRITPYDTTLYNSSSSCFLGKGTPTHPPYPYIAAPNFPFRISARPCGVCYELTGSAGSIRVMVTNHCPICNQDMLHFDLAEETFPFLVERFEEGVSYVSYREVSCDVEGPVKLMWKEGSNVYNFYVVIWNHAVGVEYVEIFQPFSVDNLDEGEWIRLRREWWGAFVWDKKAVFLPFKLRVVSFYRDSLEITVEEIGQPLTILDFPRQFKIPRDLSKDFEGKCCKPQERHSVVYEDGELKGYWLDWSQLQENFKETENPHSGKYSISATLPAWTELGYGCMAEAIVDQFSFLEFWARTNLPSYEDLRIRFVSALNGNAKHNVDVPGVTNEWKKFQVAVFGSIPFDSFSKIAFINQGGNVVTLYLDDIRFLENSEAPDLSRCASGIYDGVPSQGGSKMIISNIATLLFLVGMMCLI